LIMSMVAMAKPAPKIPENFTNQLTGVLQ